MVGTETLLLNAPSCSKSEIPCQQRNHAVKLFVRLSWSLFINFNRGKTITYSSGVTHPSEPNYVASIGGEYFGMDNDYFNQIPSNISSVIDLLEDKGISWGHYQEDMPYSGFEGIAWVNQRNGANDYVRKHSENTHLLCTASLDVTAVHRHISIIKLIFNQRSRHHL